LEQDANLNNKLILMRNNRKKQYYIDRIGFKAQCSHVFGFWFHSLRTNLDIHQAFGVVLSKKVMLGSFKIGLFGLRHSENMMRDAKFSVQNGFGLVA